MTSYIQKKLAHGEEAMEQYITILTYTYKYGYDKATTIEDMREALNETPKDVVLAFSRNLPSFMQYGQEATSQVINGIVDVDVSVSSVEVRQATLSAKVKNFDINSFATIIEAGYMVKGDGQEKKYTADFDRSSTSLPSTKVSGLKPATDYEAYAYIRTSLTTYKSQTATFTTKEGNRLCPDDHHPRLIDLGLPSGTKWACCNVGANSPEECGDYYAWGETSVKSDYASNTYKFYGKLLYLTKYCMNGGYGTVDNKAELDLVDDAAYVNWGAGWRMPSVDQQDELLQYCTWTWDFTKNGYTVVGPNTGSIFLPAAGYINSSLHFVGNSGLYWSRSLYTSDSEQACYLDFNWAKAGWYYCPRNAGLSIRPVCP